MDASPNSAGSDRPPVILLGLGFTTQRLARRLLFRGLPVYAVIRNPERFRNLVSLGLRLADAPPQSVLVHTVPPLPEPENTVQRNRIASLNPGRVIYISSTGVYGRHVNVTAETPVDPSTLKGRLRISEENWVREGPWESLIVRPAAIYGPGRGVHLRIANGEAPRGTGPGIVSRIHVDDLAAVLEAAITSDAQGAWPLADDRPCSSDEINEFCGRWLRVSVKEPPAASAQTTGRSVDGTAIRRLLGVSLAYPDYQAGILASAGKLI